MHVQLRLYYFFQTAGGSTDNKLVYGSLNDETQDLHKEKYVSKYYSQPLPDGSSYSKKDYTHLHNNIKLTNMFSLGERTSAELTKKTKEIKDAGELFQCFSCYFVHGCAHLPWGLDGCAHLPQG